MPLASVFPPVVVYRTNSATLATFGGNNTPLKSALAYVRDYDTTIANLVLPPSSKDHPGFQKIETEPKKHKLHVDGVLVTAGQVVGMYSRDCPVTFLLDTIRNEGVLIHCGRPAMTPRHNIGSLPHTVITEAMTTLIQRGSRPKDLRAVITASICPTCFTHNPDTDAALIAPFLQWYPHVVNQQTGGIDIVTVIKSQLIACGVDEDEIKHDGYCTKESSKLTSKRGGDKDSNLTVAFIH